MKRQEASSGSKLGLPGRNLIDPPYVIQNAAGSLSNKTISTDIRHYNGLVEYDTHNLYGTMMSNTSVNAMRSRRPDERTLVITRSTFLGAGKYVAHWLGDNLSNWHLYRTSIAQMLAFNSMFQIPMVGSDICGFGSNTTENLCARWMMLGAFYPFMRNHNELGAISQEAYRWESVAAASRYAIDIRYRMLDYFYTAFYEQTVDGTPSLNPLFYIYPEDINTFGIDTQFFWGSAVLISPVLEENSTSVDIYLPNDVFYDWNNGLKPVRGNGETISLEDIDFQTIPIHVRGGSILPLRMESANTTTQLRTKPFEVIVAPSLNGTANGTLYMDDGLSLQQASTTYINFSWNGSTLSVRGSYEHDTGMTIDGIKMLGVSTQPRSVTYMGTSLSTEYNGTSQVLTITCDIPLNRDADVYFDQIKAFTGGSQQAVKQTWVMLCLTLTAAVWSLI
jgi:alpha-glucosidase